jgi:hypothetical protein
MACPYLNYQSPTRAEIERSRIFHTFCAAGTRAAARSTSASKKIVARYLLTEIASALTGGSLSYLLARCTNSASGFI